MTFSTINPLPPAPSRFVQPADFELQVDNYLAGHTTFVSELNTVIDELNAQLAPATYTLQATQASSTITPADITGLTHTLVANRNYKITAYITYQSATTTTGITLGFVSPSGSIPMLGIHIPQESVAAATMLHRVFPTAALTTTGTVTSTGVTAINSNHTAVIEGIVLAGATGGTFKLQFASEVSSSAVTLQIGSTLLVEVLP